MSAMLYSVPGRTVWPRVSGARGWDPCLTGKPKVLHQGVTSPLVGTPGVLKVCFVMMSDESIKTIRYGELYQKQLPATFLNS